MDWKLDEHSRIGFSNEKVLNQIPTTTKKHRQDANNRATQIIDWRGL